MRILICIIWGCLLVLPTSADSILQIWLKKNECMATCPCSNGNPFINIGLKLPLLSNFSTIKFRATRSDRYIQCEKGKPVEKRCRLGFKFNYLLQDCFIISVNLPFTCSKQIGPCKSNDDGSSGEGSGYGSWKPVFG